MPISDKSRFAFGKFKKKGDKFSDHKEKIMISLMDFISFHK